MYRNNDLDETGLEVDDYTQSPGEALQPGYPTPGYATVDSANELALIDDIIRRFVCVERIHLSLSSF